MKMVCYKALGDFVIFFEEDDEELAISEEEDNTFSFHWEHYWPSFNLSFETVYDTVKNYGFESQFLDWLIGKDFE